MNHTQLQRRLLAPFASGRGEEIISIPAKAARIVERLFKGGFLSREVCDHILAVLRKTKTGGISMSSRPDS